MIKIVLLVFLMSVTIAGIVITAWQSIFEKANDSVLLGIAIVSIACSIPIGYVLRDSYLPTGVGEAVMWIIIALTALAFIYSVFGIATGKDLFSQRSYDGMAGMLPLLVLGLSIVLALLAYGAKLFIKES